MNFTTDDQIPPGKNNVQMSISALPSGIYIVKLQAGKEAVIQKIVKY